MKGKLGMDFIIDTLFQGFFAFFWLIGLVIFLFTEKNKKKYIFLIFLIPPLMGWSIYSYVKVLKPRFKDIGCYIDEKYNVTRGKCTMVHSSTKATTPSFVLDNKTYYYNARVNKIYEGKNYKLKYLPNSKYVLKAEEIN